MINELKKKVRRSISKLPISEGPIKVTEKSHPFSSMAFVREPLDLNSYGYVEEEYFLTGTANVYEEEGADSMKVIEEELPYKNRMLIRKPKKPEQFSGRVYIDIYNASNGYDIEDVWRRSYNYYLENGDIYIGITSKPINVWSLKNFDYERYHTLNWSAATPVPQPATVNKNMSIPGTEEGLFWDILSQLAHLVRSQKAPFLDGYSVKNLYLTGQSQSGMYLNTYVYYFHPYLKNDKGEALFDGYLNVVGAGVMRQLNQREVPGQMFAAVPAKTRHIDIPFITLSSHGDIELFGQFEIAEDNLFDGSTEENKVRHYELTSSPHTDPASPLIPDNSEIVKTKNPPKILDGEYHYTVNDIQLAYYVNSSLERIHQWAEHGIVPPPGLKIDREDDGEILNDEHGNGLGGLRSPYIDVPIATYYPNARAANHQINQTVGNVNGSMTFFSTETFVSLYETTENYLKLFYDAVDKQESEGWLLPSDAKRTKRWAEEVAAKRYTKKGVKNNG